MRGRNEGVVGGGCFGGGFGEGGREREGDVIFVGLGEKKIRVIPNGVGTVCCVDVMDEDGAGGDILCCVYINFKWGGL